MAARPSVGLRYVLTGIVLYGVARIIELRGDVAPIGTAGISGERLLYHGLALLMMLGALASFLRGACLMIRTLVRRPAKAVVAEARVFADADNFDADAALARYMGRKREENAPTPPAPHVPAATFGRKPG